MSKPLLPLLLFVLLVSACASEVTHTAILDVDTSDRDAASDVGDKDDLFDVGPEDDVTEDTATAEDVDPFDVGDDVGRDASFDADDAATDSGEVEEDVPDDSSDTSDPWTGTPCTVNGVDGVCMDVSACTGDRRATPGHCPGPAEIQCCTAVTEPTTCDESAMPRPNEGLAEAPGVGGCPDGMIPITTFCIDQYEASLIEVLGGAQERSWSPYFNPGARRVRAVSIEGAVPQGYIDQVRASAACQESGKRLCTDTEWLRACQGPSSTTYPYGDTRQDGVCNDARGVHPAVEYFGTSANWIFSELGNPCLNQLADGLALAGEHAGCVTAEGVFDMMGNLHEWTADPAGTFRGGFYVDTVRNGPGCLYRTIAHDVGHSDYSTGFRCCADR